MPGCQRFRCRRSDWLVDVIKSYQVNINPRLSPKITIKINDIQDGTENMPGNSAGDLFGMVKT